MKHMIERILNRFGYSRQQPITELIVFTDARAARAAGFRGPSHPQHRHLRAWWPGAGIAGLMCRPVQRVTIGSDLQFTRVGDEGKLVDILRKRQMVWGDQAMWVEL